MRFFPPLRSLPALLCRLWVIGIIPPGHTQLVLHSSRSRRSEGLVTKHGLEGCIRDERTQNLNGMATVNITLLSITRTAKSG